MNNKQKQAIILGATGLTGRILVDKLLKDPRYSKVILFLRRSIGISHEKLITYTIDLLALDEHADKFVADEVYCCIGTTAKKTPDKVLYRKIDYGIPSTAARLSRQNNIGSFLVISSLGANPKSSIFYSRTKGEMEQEVLSEKIPKTHILRPSFIIGDRKENRLGEKIGVMAFRLMQPLMIGSWRKYRAIQADVIAQAMISLANDYHSEDQIIESDLIHTIGNLVPQVTKT